MTLLSALVRYGSVTSATLVVGLSASAQCVPDEVARLFAEDGSEDDRFGKAVAIDHNTLLVSAISWDGPGGEPIGAVFVFMRDGGEWHQQAELRASDGAVGDGFGGTVAIRGDIAAIGAPGVDGPGGGGAAYVFVREGGAWIEQAKLFAPDGDWAGGFGAAVGVHNSTIVVGAVEAAAPGVNSGAVYVFVNTTGAWEQQARLAADNGHMKYALGASVVIEGDTCVAGAPLAEGTFGGAFVFQRENGQWTQVFRLENKDVGMLGRSVAFSGGIAVVGARLDAPFGDKAGSATVFRGFGDAWVKEAMLTSPDGGEEDEFGTSVAVSHGVVVVGAPEHDEPGEFGAGASYVFVREGGGWSSAMMLESSGGSFGASASAFGGTAVLGAPFGKDPDGVETGSASVFDVGCLIPCYGDCDQSDALDLFDFLCFTNAFNAADAYADCSEDGEHDLFDFLCFVNAFNEGCP